MTREQWIDRLNATQTEGEWNDVCKDIKAEFQGVTPDGWPDWWGETVLFGGVMDAATERFGGGGLTVTPLRWP